MSARIVFSDDTDENSFDLEFFVNTKNRLFINVFKKDEMTMGGCITISKEEVVILIAELKKCLKDFSDNGSSEEKNS